MNGDVPTIGFNTEGSLMGTIMAVPIALWAVFTLVASIALTVRRFHDRGLAGWVFALCVVGYVACGVGALVQLIICLLPSKADNKYGADPRTNVDEEYTSGTSIGASIIACVFFMILMMVGAFLNMSTCGVKGFTNKETVFYNGDDDAITEEPDEEPGVEIETKAPVIGENTETTEQEASTEALSPEEVKEKWNTYDIVIGDKKIAMTVPDEAEYITANETFLSYAYQGVDIVYRDSYMSNPEDIVTYMKEDWDYYTNDQDNSSQFLIDKSVEPCETEINGKKAYYEKVVNDINPEAEESSVYEVYTFIVDIGASNYMYVEISAPEGYITENDAAQIANIGL